MLRDTLRNNQKKRKSSDEAAVPGSTSTAARKPNFSGGGGSSGLDESPFPRGGGSALMPLEYKAVATAAKEDALFEAAEGDADAPTSGTLIQQSATGELLRAHTLQRKQLVAGVRILGAVSEISSDRLIVQLPNRLTGRIGREEVSDELYDLAAQDDGSGRLPPLPDLRKLFRVGEVLCCAALPAAK